MKIQKANAGPLTNFEVLEFLRSRGASKDPARVMSSLAPSEFKVYDYLVESAACNQTRESINEFIEKSKEYQLAKAEIVNILNIRPSSAVEIAPLIEQWETRMEDKIEELVEMVTQVLPDPPQPNSDEQAAVDDSAEATREDKINAEDQMATEEEKINAEDQMATEEENINAEDQAATEEEKTSEEEQMEVS